MPFWGRVRHVSEQFRCPFSVCVFPSYDRDGVIPYGQIFAIWRRTALVREIWT